MKNIIQPLEHIDVYINNIKDYQKQIYEKIINYLINSTKTDDKNENTNEKLGYNKMQVPLEALNITFPVKEDDIVIDNNNINEFIGKDGLSRIVENVDKYPYRYLPEYLESDGKSIFSMKHIEKYSSKIYSIVNSILNNDGITLVYSQYLYGGLIPLALALEEINFKRFTSKHNLLDDNYKSKNRIFLENH